MDFFTNAIDVLQTLVIALGGGVVGDLTGLAAALYMRGIDFVQIPTTLLAMVDSSVGGKTAVNLPSGKNLCGAFYQPKLVICDMTTLSTLPKEIYAEGVAEVIKYGAICSPEILNELSSGGDMDAVIRECVRIKGEIVEQDERDTGLRQLLNFGHTFGHAIEKLNDFSIYHGEGVATGMLIAAYTAEKRGLCAAVSLMARDRASVNIAFQMPLYPMLDDRDTESSRDNHGQVWNTRKNHIAWKLYLRGTPKGHVPAYAAPARAQDVSGLLPAYTFVGDGEPFYVETLHYIEALKSAGIPADVDVYHTDIHAFDMMRPELEISKAAAEKFNRAFAYAREHYFAENA